MRIIVVQPALPPYRRPLFARMAAHFGPSFTVYASASKVVESRTEERLNEEWQHCLGPVRRMLPGLDWQTGALLIPIAANDVLVVSGAPRTLSTLVLMAKAKCKGAKVLWWGHYWSSTSRPWRAALRLALMRFADSVIFYSDREVEDYRDRQRVPVAKPVVGLNNGIETDSIKKLRTPYSAANRPRDLLFVGRLTAKAEVNLLLDALAHPGCADVTLDVIGEGPDLADLQAQARELGIGDRVTWHGASRDEAFIAAIANRCKAFVYPGAVGLSLVHGLAYGLPALVHEDGKRQMPEYAALEPGFNGVTFHPGHVASLANEIIGMLEATEKLDRLSAGAISVTNGSFNVADMARRFIRAIESVGGRSCGQRLNPGGSSKEGDTP